MLAWAISVLKKIKTSAGSGDFPSKVGDVSPSPDLRDGYKPSFPVDFPNKTNPLLIGFCYQLTSNQLMIVKVG
jgi:hypothetical protein